KNLKNLFPTDQTASEEIKKLEESQHQQAISNPDKNPKQNLGLKDSPESAGMKQSAPDGKISRQKSFLSILTKMWKSEKLGPPQETRDPEKEKKTQSEPTGPKPP